MSQYLHTKPSQMLLGDIDIDVGKFIAFDGGGGGGGVGLGGSVGLGDGADLRVGRVSTVAVGVGEFRNPGVRFGV